MADLKSINFSSDKVISVELSDDVIIIELARTGYWKSNTHGEVRLTQETFRQAVENFNNNICRLADRDGKPQLPLNFAHDKGREAAGWIKALQLTENDTVLSGVVELTPIGKEKLINKEFSYPSIEFSYKWTDSELDKTFDNVLTGAALTNIPFIKGLKSIELAEIFSDSDIESETNNNLKLNNMDSILESIGNLTDEEKIVLLGKLQGMIKTEEKEEIVTSDHKDDMSGHKDDKEMSKDKDMSEKDSEEMEKLKSKIALQEKELHFSELLINGKVVPAQKEAFLSDDIVGVINNSSSKEINLSQESSSEVPVEPKKEKIDCAEKAQEKLSLIASDLRKENSSLDFSDSMKEALRKNPDLSKIYNQIQ